MTVKKLDNGNLLVPRRAEGEDGMLGDSMVEIGPDDSEYAAWITWITANPESKPDADSNPDPA